MKLKYLLILVSRLFIQGSLTQAQSLVLALAETNPLASDRLAQPGRRLVVPAQKV